jgi:hypothetical protein
MSPFCRCNLRPKRLIGELISRCPETGGHVCEFWRCVGSCAGLCSSAMTPSTSNANPKFMASRDSQPHWLLIFHGLRSVDPNLKTSSTMLLTELCRHVPSSNTAFPFIARSDEDAWVSPLCSRPLVQQSGPMQGVALSPLLLHGLGRAQCSYSLSGREKNRVGAANRAPAPALQEYIRLGTSGGRRRDLGI